MRKVVSAFLFSILLSLVGCGSDAATEPVGELAAAEVDLGTAVPPTATFTPEPSPTSRPQPVSVSEPIAGLDLEATEPAVAVLPAAESIALGDDMLFKSKWEVAEEMYLQAIATEPENALAYARLAYLYLQQPQTEVQAVVNAEKAVELAPDDGEMKTYLMMAYSRNGEHGAALELAEEVAPFSGDNPFVLAITAEIYLYLGKYQEARGLIDQAVALNSISRKGDVFDVHRVKIKMAVFENHFDAATIQSYEFIQKYPEFAPVYQIFAEIKDATGSQGNVADDAIEQGLTLAPNFIPLLAQSARHYILLEGWDAALEQCDQIVEIVPDIPDGYLCQGDVYLAQNDSTNALQAYGLASNVDQESYEAFFGLGKTYLNAGNCQLARTQLTNAVFLEFGHPLEYQRHTYLSLAEECVGIYSSALLGLELAAELNPNYPHMFYALGRVYVGMEMFDEAEEAFLAAIALSPTYNESYFADFGNLLASRGDCGEGESLEVDAFLCVGQMMLAREEYTQAVNVFGSALVLDEDSEAALEGTAVAYSGLQLCRSAETPLNTLLELYPDNTVAQTAYEECVALAEAQRRPPESLISSDEMVSEEEAIRSILRIVSQISGVDEVIVNIEDIDFDGDMLPVMYVSYIIDGNMSGEDFEVQLENVTRQVIKSFVLTESVPTYLVVGAYRNTLGLIDGYAIPYYSAAMWFAGRLDYEPFKFGWMRLSDFDEPGTGV